jgi:hypothetical protein
MKKVLATIFVTAGLFGCSKEIQSPVMPVSNPIKPAPVYTDNITYLALGDSYTIGEAVEAPKSFPYQLAAQLKLAGHNTPATRILLPVPGGPPATSSVLLMPAVLQTKNTAS